MCVCVCVSVCVCGYACASFILLLTEETAASSLTTSGASIPCSSLTLHIKTVTDFLSSSFLPPLSSPSVLFIPHSLPSPPLPPYSPFTSSISPCSVARCGPLQLGWTVLAYCGQPSLGHWVPSPCHPHMSAYPPWCRVCRAVQHIEVTVEIGQCCEDHTSSSGRQHWWGWCVPVCICGVVADTYVHMCTCTNIVIVIA